MTCVPIPSGSTATYTSSGLAYYSHADWLGSARFFSTPSQTMYGDLSYAPFGEVYGQSGSTDISFTRAPQPPRAFRGACEDSPLYLRALRAKLPSRLSVLPPVPDSPLSAVNC
jgi:hypothetical protein